MYDVIVRHCSNFAFLFLAWFKCPVLNHIYRISSSLLWKLSLLILCHIFAKYFIVKDKKCFHYIVKTVLSV